MRESPALSLHEKATRIRCRYVTISTLTWWSFSGRWHDNHDCHVFATFFKKECQTGSPNRLALSLNLTFRGFCKNHVCKVPIDCSTCPGFISIPFAKNNYFPERNGTERKHQFGCTRERKKRFAQWYCVLIILKIILFSPMRLPRLRLRFE